MTNFSKKYGLAVEHIPQTYRLIFQTINQRRNSIDTHVGRTVKPIALLTLCFIRRKQLARQL